MVEETERTYSIGLMVLFLGYTVNDTSDNIFSHIHADLFKCNQALETSKIHENRP